MFVVNSTLNNLVQKRNPHKNDLIFYVLEIYFYIRIGPGDNMIVFDFGVQKIANYYHIILFYRQKIIIIMMM